jgi:hypothetical protein
MNRILAITALTLAVSPHVLCQAKPNFSGVWKLQSDQVTEILKIDHQEPNIRMIYDIEDDAGKRTLDLRVMTDGKEHKQEVQGLPATLIAKWEGDALIFEINRQAPFGPVHNRRTMKLSKDGKIITAERINFSPDAQEISRSTETWQKQ